jgi:hypothetical protein
MMIHKKEKSKIHDIECVRETPPWEAINPYIITKFGCSSVVPIQWIAESIGSRILELGYTFVPSLILQIRSSPFSTVFWSEPIDFPSRTGAM